MITCLAFNPYITAQELFHFQTSGVNTGMNQSLRATIRQTETKNWNMRNSLVPMMDYAMITPTLDKVLNPGYPGRFCLNS
jgi:hypothetical protein